MQPISRNRQYMYEHLKDIRNGTVLLTKLNPFKKYSTVMITAQDQDYLRVKVLIDDIVDFDPYNDDIDVDGIVILLFNDFLNQIRKNTNIKEIAETLTQKRKYYFQPHLPVKDSYPSKTPKRKKWIHHPVRFKRASLLRAEVFLHDISSIDPKFNMSIEQLMSILLMDFASDLRAGRTEEIIDRILYLKEEFDT